MKQFDGLAGLKAIAGNFTPKIRTLTNWLPDNAYIAGGFVRDMYHRKPFKDLDIIVGSYKADTIAVKAAVKEVFGEQVKFELVQEDKPHYNNGRINCVFKSVGCPIDIDIIVLNTKKVDAMFIMSGFDLSLNQGIIDKKGGVNRYYYNTSNVVYTVNDFDAIKPQRLKALKEKFPELDWSNFPDRNRRDVVPADWKVGAEDVRAIQREIRDEEIRIAVGPANGLQRMREMAAIQNVVAGDVDHEF